MTGGRTFGLVMMCTTLGMSTSACSEHMGRGWDWNRMRMQPRYEPFRASAFFADRKAMQLPPPGTVSRESGLMAESPNPSPSPSPVTRDVLARGASQFRIYCAVCHGERGDGASLVARDMDEPRPTSLIAPPVSLMPAPTVAVVIANGVGSMPSFSADLSPADRRAVAEYVITLRR